MSKTNKTNKTNETSKRNKAGEAAAVNQTSQKNAAKTVGKTSVQIRKLTMTAMLSAIGFVLQLIEFSIPIMPGFIKLDFSDLPALIASFSMGPLSGVAVCLIKNILQIPFGSSGGVGEMSNFILGAAFVVPAGLIYAKWKTKKGALAGSLTGALVMAAISVATNYFIVYPIYTNFMPMEAIIAAYQAINPKVDSLLDALLWFNMPFTFAKGLCCALITFLVYKHISPIIKGTRRELKKEQAKS